MAKVINFREAMEARAKALAETPCSGDEDIDPIEVAEDIRDELYELLNTGKCSCSILAQYALEFLEDLSVPDEVGRRAIAALKVGYVFCTPPGGVDTGHEEELIFDVGPDISDDRKECFSRIIQTVRDRATQSLVISPRARGSFTRKILNLPDGDDMSIAARDGTVFHCRTEPFVAYCAKQGTLMLSDYIRIGKNPLPGLRYKLSAEDVMRFRVRKNQAWRKLFPRRR